MVHLSAFRSILSGIFSPKKFFNQKKKKMKLSTYSGPNLITEDEIDACRVYFNELDYTANEIKTGVWINDSISKIQHNVSDSFVALMMVMLRYFYQKYSRNPNCCNNLESPSYFRHRYDVAEEDLIYEANDFITTLIAHEEGQKQDHCLLVKMRLAKSESRERPEIPEYV